MKYYVITLLFTNRKLFTEKKIINKSYDPSDFTGQTTESTKPSQDLIFLIFQKK